MAPARTGPHSEGSLDMGGAGLEGRRDHREVIEAGGHVR